MRILCTHGYFRFEETKAGQMGAFVNVYGLDIIRVGDLFTFESLRDAPEYSLAGGTFLECPTTETFEGRPWSVMRANGLVYDFNTDAVVPIESIIQSVKLQSAGNFYLAPGLILPGSVLDDGTRVTDYSAFFEAGQVKYSEVVSE